MRRRKANGKKVVFCVVGFATDDGRLGVEVELAENINISFPENVKAQASQDMSEAVAEAFYKMIKSRDKKTIN